MKEHYNSVVDKWVKEAENIITSWPGYSNFLITTCKKDWSRTRRTSRGGCYKDGFGINLAMATLVMPNDGRVKRFYEYASYDDDPRIGGFYFLDTEHKLAAITLHEIAHAVQFFADKEGLYKFDKPHGLSFKIPYAKLRTTLLNKHIPVYQQDLKHRYEKLTNMVISTNGLSIIKKSSTI